MSASAVGDRLPPPGSRILLSGWAGSPRWGLILGLSLLAGLAAAALGYRLVPGKGRRVRNLVVAAAFLTGGLSGFLIVIDQDFALATPDRPCAAGPWTERWDGSHETYAALPDEGPRGAFEVTTVLAPGNGTVGPWGGPPSWTDAKVEIVTWETPRDRIGNASAAKVLMIRALPGDGLDIRVAISGSDDEAIARTVVTWALENVTGASGETIERWVASMPGDQASKAYVEIHWTIENATFDPTRLVETKSSWGPASGPPHPMYRSANTDAARDHPYPPLAGALVRLEAENWTMGLLPAMKVAEGTVNRSEVRFTVTGFGEAMLQTESYLPAERWPALANDVYAELGLGEPPDRDWHPSPGAVC